MPEAAEKAESVEALVVRAGIDSVEVLSYECMWGGGICSLGWSGAG